jgi:serine/threonine protein phosphatase PrpC
MAGNPAGPGVGAINTTSESVVTRHRLEFATRTDKGLVRRTNEDAFGTLPDDGMVVVADGMGGYSAGEVASQLAVDAILRHLHRSLDSAPGLADCQQQAVLAVDAANLAIWRATDKAPELKGMGTTVVVGIFLPRQLAYVWVGDSRLYRLRDGMLEQLTTDHTLVQELVSQGMFDTVAEAMEAGVGDNVLTRALGGERTVPVAQGSTDLRDGDLYLFCSDGLNHMVGDETIRLALTDGGPGLGARAERLIRVACEAGGMDNITVVLVQVGPEGHAATTA